METSEPKVAVSHQETNSSTSIFGPQEAMMKEGFEPTHAEHDGLAVHHLIHWAASSCYLWY